MLYFHNSCTILKPTDYRLVSDFNIWHSICAHTLVRLERHRLNTFLQEVKRNSGLNYLKFVVSVSEVLAVLVDRHLQNDFQHIHIAFLHASIISGNSMQ